AWNTDIRAARQVVGERMAALAGVLPEGVRPHMTPPTSIMGEIMRVGLYRRQAPQGGESFQKQQMDLRITADWVIRPRLLQVPGIAEVLVMGGDRKQYQVLVDPNALLEYDVTLQQVEQAVKGNNLNASGGFTVEGQQERPIRV